MYYKGSSLELWNVLHDYVVEGWWLNAIRVADKGCFRTNGGYAMSPFSVFVEKCTENACDDGVYDGM